MNYLKEKNSTNKFKIKTDQFIKGCKTETVISLLLIFIFVASLIPIFLLGRYDYPSADDYGFSTYSHIAWTQTHSVLQVLKEAGHTVIERWNSWQGTFSSIFVMALQPGIWGKYSLTPWIMIGAMSLSTLFFLHTVLVKLIHARPAIFLSISMIYLIFALQCMIDKTQGFFWFNGAAHYMIPHSVALCLFGLLILMVIDEQKFVFRFILSCLLSFFVGGSNYITALIAAILFVTAMLFLSLSKQKKWRRLLVPFLFFVAAFLLNTLAPGNSVRQEEMLVRPGVIKSILMSFYYCIEYIIDTWINWTYLLFILALLPFLWEAVKALGHRFTYRAPLLVLIYSYCVLSAMFTPSLFASGEAGGGRIFNIIFLDSMLFVIAGLFYCMGWINQRLEMSKNFEHGKNFSKSCLESADVRWYLLSILCLGVFIGAMYMKVNPDNFTTSSAIYSLATKEAASYGSETDERDRLLHEQTDGDITIPQLTVRPYLLFWSDIEEYSDDWKNKSMARYYQKDSISGN